MKSLSSLMDSFALRIAAKGRSKVDSVLIRACFITRVLTAKIVLKVVELKCST